MMARAKQMYIWARSGRKPPLVGGNAHGDAAMLRTARFGLPALRCRTLVPGLAAHQEQRLGQDKQEKQENWNGTRPEG
jgi:hypothetical protein